MDHLREEDTERYFIVIELYLDSCTKRANKLDTWLMEYIRGAAKTSLAMRDMRHDLNACPELRVCTAKRLRRAHFAVSMICRGTSKRWQRISLVECLWTFAAIFLMIWFRIWEFVPLKYIFDESVYQQVSRRCNVVKLFAWDLKLQFKRDAVEV